MLSASLILIGCSPIRGDDVNQMLSWHYDDLRLIDPVDAEHSNMDIIALYVKEHEDDLLLRLDLLEMNLTDPQDIYISFDYQPGGSQVLFPEENSSIQANMQWDATFVFPYDGQILGYDSQWNVIPGSKSRIFRDTNLDTITISIEKREFLPKGTPVVVEALVVDPVSHQVRDRLGPVSSKSIPPKPARIIIGFWNTHASFTPAQALRAWDGAHAGPESSRHGLKNLITATENSGINIVFYDLCSPVSIVGLNYLGVYRRVMGLAGGVCLVARNGCGCLGCVSDYAKFFLSNDDLTLETRKQIVGAAIDGNVLFIGGNFSDSAWGNPIQASTASNYIKNHPWIQTLRTTDLVIHEQVLRNDCSSYGEVPPGIEPDIHQHFIKQYLTTPNNNLKELARQTYSMIISSQTPEANLIKDNYLGQLGHILAAAAWTEDPLPISTCNLDLDWDGLNECVLSSEKFFLTFEATGGYLAFAFYRDESGVHQITAPMSEVVVGLGDPSTFDKDYGVFADPSLVQGTLARFHEREYLFTHQNGPNSIELYSEIAGIQKTFQIDEYNLLIKWDSVQAVGYIFPFGIDPWQRYEINWSDRYFYGQPAVNHWTLGIEDEIAIVIQSLSQAQFSTFLDSKDLVGKPEDPNYDYPRGHYLPFPFAILEVAPTQAGFIEVKITNP